MLIVSMCHCLKTMFGGKGKKSCRTLWSWIFLRKGPRELRMMAQKVRSTIPFLMVVAPEMALPFRAFHFSRFPLPAIDHWSFSLPDSCMSSLCACSRFFHTGRVFSPPFFSNVLHYCSWLGVNWHTEYPALLFPRLQHSQFAQAYFSKLKQEL